MEAADVRRLLTCGCTVADGRRLLTGRDWGRLLTRGWRVADGQRLLTGGGGASEQRGCTDRQIVPDVAEASNL